MEKHTIQCFIRATYHICVLNIACAGACECDRTPLLSSLGIPKNIGGKTGSDDPQSYSNRLLIYPISL